MERLSKISSPEKRHILEKKRSVDNIRKPQEVSEATERNFLRRRASSEILSKREKKNQEWYDNLDSFRNLPPDSQRYLKEATQARIKQLEDVYNKANKELMEGYVRQKEENRKKPDEQAKLDELLDKEVSSTKKELTDKLEREKNVLRAQLQHNSSKYLPWLQHKLAEEMADQEKRDARDSALKAYGDVPAKLLEASTKYEKETEGVKQVAVKMQEAYKNLCNARAASLGASHEEITFNNFDKALTEAQSNQAIQDKAKKAGEDARKNQTVPYPNDKIREAVLAIDAEADGDKREAQVKQLLEDTIIKDHTIFRLTKSEDSATHLNTDEHKQKRLNEITSQDKVKEAIQRINEGTDANNRGDFIKGKLEIVVREAYLYSLDKNAQEAVIHQEAADLFSERISASAETRQDALKAVIASNKPGRQANMDRIKNANKQVHAALNQIQNFSPEAMKARNNFRGKHSEDAPATRPPTAVERDEALYRMQEFTSKDPEAVGALPQEVEDHINVGTGTGLSHIQAFSKASIDKLNTLGQREPGDNANIDANAFNNLRKQISDRYDSKIDQARIEDKKARDDAQKIYDAELQRIENFRPPLLEQTKKALEKYNASTVETTQRYEKLVAERDAALNEARQLYSKESVSHYINEVREQAKNLHAQLNKRDKALLAVDDVIDAGYRAAAIKIRYEKSQYGEALKLDDDILHQMKEGEKFIAAEREAIANIAAVQDRVHDADHEYSLAKEDWEIKLREWNQIEKRKYEGTDEAGKEALDKEKTTAKQLVEDARKVRDTAFAHKEEVRTVMEKAVKEKDVKTAEKLEADDKLHMLYKERELAGKRDDANDARYFRFLDRIRDDMKSTMAFERQRILMKDHYKQQIKAAVIAGISQSVADSFKRIEQAQYIGINNMLIRS